MESRAAERRAGWAGCVLTAMTNLAILLTFFSVMSRADCESEVVEGHVVGLVVVAPLWAAVTFAYSLWRRGSKSRAMIFACAVYVLVASSLFALNTWKWKVRSAPWDRMRSEDVMETPARPAP
jgi:hypothetical protein